MIHASDRVHAVATRISERRPRLAAGRNGSSARVHSCFRSALNIATPDGLLTVASEALGVLPNGIVADLGPDFRALGIRVGMAVEGNAVRLSIPDVGFRLDIAGATTWSPRILPSGDGAIRTAARWRQRSAPTRALALERAVEGGLAGLLETSPARGRPRSLDVTELARPILRALAGALADGDRPAAARWAHGLIGLGPGLTPSGDDVLVGVEAALHALGRPSAGFLGRAVGDVDARTTTVAATLLRHAARGEFAERLHVLLVALLARDDAAIPDALQRAVAWGATSGTDCLVGVLCGLDVATAHDRWLA